MSKFPGHVVDVANLPLSFPTHRHEPDFWTALGRAVATFGFLEETLGKAIFAFTATRTYPLDEIDDAFVKWLPTLQRALSDALGGLIDTYAKAVRSHQDVATTGFAVLVDDLKSAATWRNVICHGSWRLPDNEGRSVPLFVNKNNKIVTDLIDIAFLEQIQRQTALLVCAVVDSVTHIGWQFPGSGGPGVPIMTSGSAGDKLAIKQTSVDK